jgi:hypothetical protein
MKTIIFIFLLLSLHNCISLQDKAIGTWKLTAEINSEDSYAKRSSLKETKIISEKKIILNKDSTFTSDLNLCNEWNPNLSYVSKGVYHFKKKRNPDRLFWLECTGIYPDHYFILKDEKLELYLPSITGYHIQIFDKQIVK